MHKVYVQSVMTFVDDNRYKILETKRQQTICGDVKCQRRVSIFESFLVALRPTTSIAKAAKNKKKPHTFAATASSISISFGE